MAANAKFTLDPGHLHTLYVVEKRTPAAIAEMLGCSATKVRKSLTALDLLGTGRTPYRRHTSCERMAKRRGCEFSASVKRQRFEEERGHCQLCGELIGEGEAWQDRGPGAGVTYHHIRMVCQGGDGSPSNCMVLHKMCHGGKGTGLPLNPVLHEGRQFSYDYKITLAPCATCGALRALTPTGECPSCARRRPTSSCAVCGEAFRSKNPSATFCSNKCRGAALASYTDEDLRRETPFAHGKLDLMRRLGMKTLGGGPLQRLNRELERLGLNCGGRF